MKIDSIKTSGIICALLGLGCAFLYCYPETWPLYSVVKEFYANLSTELISISITILLINHLYAQKERQSNKKRLLNDLSSPNNAFAARALKELKEMGALLDNTLNGIDLSKADLSGLDLSGVILTNVNLANAKLVDTNFKNAIINNSNLNGADINSANFEQCKLSNVEMKQCNLYSTILSGATIKNCDFMLSDFNMSDLTNAQIIETMLEEADLKFSNLTRTKFIKCKFLRANMESVNLRSAKFERCDFRDIRNSENVIDINSAKFLGNENAPDNFNNNHQ